MFKHLDVNSQIVLTSNLKNRIMKGVPDIQRANLRSYDSARDKANVSKDDLKSIFKKYCEYPLSRYVK
jgi:hypothetical protein